MLTNEKNDQNQKKKSGWVRVGGKVILREFEYFANPLNWFDSLKEIAYGTKKALNTALGKPTEDFLSTEINRLSEDLGIVIKRCEKGRVEFKASRVLVDVTKLTAEQLDKIKTDLPNVTMNSGKNEVTIEIDVEKITREVRKTIEENGLEVSEGQVKRLVIRRIAEEFGLNLKKLGEITGGEFKGYEDLKLLKIIGEKLYQEYNNQKQELEKSSESVAPVDKGFSETIRSNDNRSVPSETVRAIEGNEKLRKFDKMLQSLGNGEPSETVRALVDDEQLRKFGSHETIKPFVGDNESSRTIIEIDKRKLSEAAEPLVTHDKRKSSEIDNGQWQKRQRVAETRVNVIER